MYFDFDTPARRAGSGCVKWDETPPAPLPAGKELLPMWVADMDFRVAPPIIEALQRRVAHGVFGYTHVPEAYYQAATRWFEHRHHWTIPPHHIIYIPGVVPALSAIVKALASEGDEVIVQSPVYNCFFSSIRNNGCAVVENPLRCVDGRYEMDFDDLERKASRPRASLMLLCNPHNPVGRLWTKDELARVSAICSKHGVKIIADEIHCEIVLNGRRYQPFATAVPEALQNAVVCASPSKAFNLAGLQNALIICARDDWRERINRAININEVCDINPFGVAGLMAAYNEGEPWLDALCQYIGDNYRLLCRFIRNRMPQLSVTPLEATYLAWIDTGGDGDAFAHRLLSEEAVWVSPGSMYGEAPCRHIRLNLACPRAQLMEALERMEHLLR